MANIKEVRSNYATSIEKKFYGGNWTCKEIIKNEQCSRCKKRGNVKMCRLDMDTERQKCNNYLRK